MATQNIKIGDRVRFMNEVGGGKVTAILSKEMVSVETKDGFEIPTYIKNLVIIEPDLPASSQRHGSGNSSQREQTTFANSSSQASSSDRYPEVKSSGFREINQFKGNEFPEFIFAALPDNQGNPTEGKINH